MPSVLRIDIQGLGPARRAAAALAPATRAAMLAEAERLAIRVQHEIEKEAPRGVHKKVEGSYKTGVRIVPQPGPRLYQTFDTQIVQRSGGNISIQVITRSPYAKYVLGGRGPVRPIRAEYLRFVTKGHFIVRTKRVGPAKANDFVGRAYAKAGPMVDNALNNIGNIVEGVWVGKASGRLFGPPAFRTLIPRRFFETR